jgi:hypothetical protein
METCYHSSQVEDGEVEVAKLLKRKPFSKLFFFNF